MEIRSHFDLLRALIMAEMLCADCGLPLLPDEHYVCESCDRLHRKHIDETCGTEFEIIEAVRREDGEPSERG